MRIVGWALIFFWSVATSPNVFAATNSQPIQIVICQDGTDLNVLIAEFKLTPTFVYRSIGGFAAPMDESTRAKLRADKRILAVEADAPVSLCTQSNSTGLVRVGADKFPVAHINGTPKTLDVDVAVLDTGIDAHPDLSVYQWWSPFSVNGSDEIGHGTAVAGIIGATDNDFGIVGVATGVRIWNIKVIGPPPDNGWSHVISGMNYVMENSNQIAVANMSLGNEGSSAPIQSIRLALRRLVSVGIVVVAAVGNRATDLAGADGVYGTGDDFIPAALPDAMGVSAMDSTIDSANSLSKDVFWLETPGSEGSNFSQIERTNNYLSGVTNYVFSPGGAIDVAGPGVDIRTTAPASITNGGYVRATGTSTAAPHVAGLVALYIAANGRATNAAGVYAIRQAIINASLPQSQWNTNNTHDPDNRPEPLAIATEAWVPAPLIKDSGGTPNSFQLGFDAVPGYDYTVQSSTNLTPPTGWANLDTVVGTNFATRVSVTDSNVAGHGYYRLWRRPSP